jgi:hypothetical protein
LRLYGVTIKDLSFCLIAIEKNKGYHLSKIEGCAIWDKSAILNTCIVTSADRWEVTDYQIKISDRVSFRVLFHSGCCATKRRVARRPTGVGAVTDNRAFNQYLSIARTGRSSDCRMRRSNLTAFGFNVGAQRLPPWATSSVVMMRQEIDAHVIMIQMFRFGCSRAGKLCSSR